MASGPSCRPNDDFDDAGWKGEFQSEMRRVVDLVHGAATIPARPGHAAGRYDADVSPWTLAYIIGREWEPFAVKAFDEGKPRRVLQRALPPSPAGSGDGCLVGAAVRLHAGL